MYKFLFLAAIILALFAGGCKQPASFEYRDVRDFKIDSLGMNTSSISMSLVYFNPNNYGIDLKHVDCDVYIDKKYLGKYVLDTLMHITKRSEFVVPSKMKIDMKNIFKNAFTTLFFNEVLIQVKGTTKVGKGGIFVNIPFNYETRQKIDMF